MPIINSTNLILQDKQKITGALVTYTTDNIKTVSIFKSSAINSNTNLNLYQTIIWDRKADVNNSLYFFQPVYELVYWLTKDNKKAPKFFKQNLIEQQSIWRISPKVNLPHPAPFPEELVEHCIVATTAPGDIVLDPFMGIGTTAVVAKRLGRRYIGFDISDEYVSLATENVVLGKVRKKKEL